MIVQDEQDILVNPEKILFILSGLIRTSFASIRG